MTHKSELLGYQGATGDFFENLQERYGATLETLHVDEKHLMLSVINLSHWAGLNLVEALEIITREGEDSSHATFIVSGLEEIDPGRQMSFCAALIAQIQSAHSLYQQFFKQFINEGVEKSLAEDTAAILANGGDRTQAECELVSEVWEQIKNNKKLAKDMDRAMGKVEA